MKKMIIIRGPSGAGKTRFAEDIGLGAYLISPDRVRNLHYSPVYNKYGHEVTSNLHNDQVMKHLGNILRERMEDGSLIVIEAVMPSQADVQRYIDIAAPYGYAVAVIDFMHTPLATCHEHNAQRHGTVAYVPPPSIQRMHERMQPVTVPAPHTHIMMHRANARATVDAWLREPIKDLSAYEAIIHIGDIQGCATVLRTALPTNNPNHYYIFLGDLLDRGIENGAVIAHLTEHFVGKANVCFIRGNHDGHIERFLRRNSVDTIATEFRYYTLPDLRRAGITNAQLQAIMDQSQDALRYTARGTEVLCNHAGLPFIPMHPERINSAQWQRGVDDYNNPLDTQFTQASRTREAQDGTILFQVHGHRNPEGSDAHTETRSFSLEESVEFGGFLRVLTLCNGTWTMERFRNTIYADGYTTIKKECDRPRTRAPLVPAWMLDADHTGPADIPMPADLLHALSSQPDLIRVKQLSNGVASYNFTRDVFHRAEWNDLTEVSRGLFVNPEDGRIVARSYTKGFSIGEHGHPEMEIDALCARIEGPLVAYVKENGSLGINGVNHKTQQLFIASKSTDEGEFAERFGDILRQKLKSTFHVERFYRLLESWGASATFEVIEPTLDPHIIDEPAVRLVLLDIIRRGPACERAGYDVVCAVAEDFGFEVKQVAMRFPTVEAFRRFYLSQQHNRAWMFKGKHIEGLMIEEDKPNGRIIAKWKSPYYTFWKQMRGYALRLHKIRQQRRRNAPPILCTIQDAEAEAFHNYLMSLPVEALEQPIVTLRAHYEQGYIPAPESSNTHAHAPILDGLWRQVEHNNMDITKARAIAAQKGYTHSNAPTHPIFQD